MRPQPVRPLPGQPEYVDGVALIRGQTVPVVQLAVLLGAQSTGKPARFVVVRAGRREVALAVDAVIGVVPLDAGLTQSVPPLLRDAAPEAIAGIGRLDRELLIVLRSSWLLPDEVWNSMRDVRQTAS